jgi:chromosome segregation ATPase
MRSNSKQHIVAKAHENPEYAAMNVADLSKVLSVSQATIYRWRRRVKRAAALCAELQPKTRKVKVTVESVRRKWEEKYAALNKQYEHLADRLIEMAQNADRHRNAEKSLKNQLNKAQTELGVTKSLLEERIQRIKKLESQSWIQRLFSSKE